MLLLLLLLLCPRQREKLREGRKCNSLLDKSRLNRCLIMIMLLKLPSKMCGSFTPLSTQWLRINFPDPPTMIFHYKQEKQIKVARKFILINFTQEKFSSKIDLDGLLSSAAFMKVICSASKVLSCIMKFKFRSLSLPPWNINIFWVIFMRLIFKSSQPKVSKRESISRNYSRISISCSNFNNSLEFLLHDSFLPRCVI